MLGGSRSPDKATLGDIINAPQLGLRGKEATQRKSSSALAARIIAARLSAWLNFILAAQDVLVDAPHLCLRCPSLLASTTSRKKWNATTRLNPKAVIFANTQLKQARFGKPFWYDRPVWFWTEIEKDRLLPEVRDPWRSSSASYVFCEDTSSFEKPASSVRFQSDLLSPYRVRHVKRVAGVDYQPAHRLALA